MVIAALTLPVFILMAAFVVDIGNWYSHKRHLQTKVDAAALAAAGKYGGNLPACSGNAVLAAQIAGVAKQYAGVVSPTPEGTASNPENTTANEPTRLEVYVNSTSYTGADNTDGGNPCYLHADNTRPYVPADADSDPDGYWTDVKARERDVPSFFGAFGIPVPQITAKARVEIHVAQGVDDTLPFAVEGSKYTPCVWAIWVNDGTGATITGPQALTRNATDPYDWSSPSSLSVAIPASANVSMQVRAGDCSDSNHQETWDLGSNKGVVFMQGYDTSGTPTATAPRVRDVVLAPSGTTPCPNAYFNSISTGTCEVSVSANIAFAGSVTPFARARLCPGFAASGSCGGYSTLSLSGGRWVGTLGTVAAGSGPQSVEIEWAGLDELGDCKDSGDPWTGNACHETFGIQQRIFMGNSNRSAVLESAEVLQGGTPANAFAHGTAQLLSAHVHLMKLENDDFSDPGIIIRSSVQESDNRSGALDCVTGNFREQIVNGCDGYQVNTRTPIPTCSPVLTPLDCVTAEPGNKQGQLDQGMTERFGCTTNYWRTSGPDRLRGSTHRPVLITYFGALDRSSGNPQEDVPVLAYAWVYITGWDSDNCGQNDPAPPTDFVDTKSSVWGHFVAFTAPPSAGVPSSKLCLTFDEAGACLAVLVD